MFRDWGSRWCEHFGVCRVVVKWSYGDLDCPSCRDCPTFQSGCVLAKIRSCPRKVMAVLAHTHALCCFQDEHGDPFYYNIYDDSVQWDPPVVLMAGIVPEIKDDDDDEAPTPSKKKKKKKSE